MNIWQFISDGTRYGELHLKAASVLSVLAYNTVLIALDEWQRHTFEAVFFLMRLVILPLYQYSLLRKIHEARREAERLAAAHFGSLAPAVWPQWRAKLEARSAADLERLCEHEREIKQRIDATLAVGAKVRRALAASGAPLRARQLGIEDAELAFAVRHGREIRSRFTVLDVAAELGILDGFAARAAAGG